MTSTSEDETATQISINHGIAKQTQGQGQSLLRPVVHTLSQVPQNSAISKSHRLPSHFQTKGCLKENYCSLDTMRSTQRAQHESEIALSCAIEMSSKQPLRRDFCNDHSTNSPEGSRKSSRVSVTARCAANSENDVSSSDSGKEGQVSSSSATSNTVSTGSGAALVTATSAISSGDDRYFSSHTRASEDISQQLSQVSPPLHVDRAQCRTEIDPPLQASIDTSAVMSDDFGLSVHMDDRIETPLGTDGKTASAVVAFLPPPCCENNSMVNFMCYTSESGSANHDIGEQFPRKSVRTCSSRKQKRPHASTHKATSDTNVCSVQQRTLRDTQSARKRQLSIGASSFSSRMSSDSGTEGGYVGEQDSSSSLSSEEESNSNSGNWKRTGNSKRCKANESDDDSSDFMDFDSDYGYSSGSMRSAAQKMKMSSIDPVELAKITLKGWLVPKPRRRSPKKPCNEVQVDKLDMKVAAATRRTLQSQNQCSLQDNYQLARDVNRDEDFVKKTAAKPVPGYRDIGLMHGKSPLFCLSSDLMACCMSYLDPPAVHNLLTMPLSKEWQQVFTRPQDLWRVLCLTPPFHAKFDSDEIDSGDESMSSYPIHSALDVKHLLGRYRLLYTSFVRCMKYLARIKDDAVNGRPPSVIDYGGADLNSLPLRTNESLKRFLARARGIVVKNKRKQIDGEGKSCTADPIGVNDDGSSIDSTGVASKRKKPNCNSSTVKYGPSQLSARLLGPSKSGIAGNINLPWSCAIYSIVNWMVAFADVEGIQTMCLKVLPALLEDEKQRTTAPLAGVTEIVLRGMVLFPDSVTLHTAAFHTIVLLARPLGGKEGMLFHSSMVNSSGIFNNGSKNDKNGIAVMLDSMRRFETDEVLQAMSCWSLVNIALAPSQKAVLVKLGGIEVVANAMIQHPYDLEVQFRALFALINLVIPSVSLPDDVNSALQEQLGDVNNPTEKEVLDEHVEQITNLVVQAMKNFCSSEAILNRACLVLHNLSLTEEFHRTLLWTPNCYQMLEWCLANYRTDRVLQQSAGGTLHRLQTTLSNNEDLRVRFTSSLQSQDQSNLEQAHLEALRLHERHELEAGRASDAR